MLRTSQAIGAIAYQHAMEGASVRDLRAWLVRAPDVKLHHLRRFDDRLAAHLDGLCIAGESAWRYCEAALEAPSAGAVFTAAVIAIQEMHQHRLDRLFALAAVVPQSCSGLMSAFGWLRRVNLQGIVTALLASAEPPRRVVGVAACAMHRVDPGLVSARRLQDPSPCVRGRALRTAGELGQTDLLGICLSALSTEDPECRFWTAWSSVMLGNRGKALDALSLMGLDPGAHRRPAFRLALQAMSTGEAHAVLQRLVPDEAQLRRVIQGSGIAGDPVYVPWFIKQMTDAKTARLAGEAFSLVTGVDLSESGLDRKQPEGFESGPNDDPDDPNVAMDPDDGLPWPDQQRIEKWWAANGSRFQQGQRYFMGALVTPEQCLDVLKNGYQRQRILAAHYLCLLAPGTPLFNTSAPAWRQQRLLATMT